MNRRGFLSLFGVTAAAIAADPEALLWTPGAKLISIPSVVAQTNVIVEPEGYYDRVNHLWWPKLRVIRQYNAVEGQNEQRIDVLWSFSGPANASTFVSCRRPWGREAEAPANAPAGSIARESGLWEAF